MSGCCHSVKLNGRVHNVGNAAWGDEVGSRKQESEGSSQEMCVNGLRDEG